MVGLMVSAMGAATLDTAAASARALAPERDCYDALVSARIVRQIPTAIPDCGDDCIIVSWPWIIELDVERVLRGVTSSRQLMVLTIQHTYFRTGLGARRWWLRRNALGTFNVLRVDNRKRPRRCAEGILPDAPYIRPAEGQTLQDLIDQGERLYGDPP